MLEQFLAYNEKEKLINKNDKILLAVSGGIDSVVMTNLVTAAGYEFDIAHCNFCLRGSESDMDEEFVKNLTQNFHCKFWVKKFDTIAHAKDNKLSIQEAARNLRYGWFSEIIKSQDYQSVAIAHHADDLVETFFINLLRGSGLSGLCGFQSRNNHIIRPILFATRTEIMDYANKNNIYYREDSSNSETKYTRNAIRQNVLPELEKINAAAVKNIYNTVHILQNIASYLEKQLDQLRTEFIRHKPEYIEIKISEIKSHIASPEILFELLKEYNFNFSTIGNLYNSLEYPKSGTVFYSDTHQILIDRETLQIKHLAESDEREYVIENPTNEINHPIRLFFREINNSENFIVSRNTSVACFDAEKIKYPLKIRQWKKGDVFIPFGMTGHKKLSDYFSDLKLSLFDKKNVWLLESGDEIIWIIGYRTSNVTRITSNTKKVLEAKIISKI